MIGVEAAGHGLDTDQHAATMTKGTIGVVDGMKTYAVFGEDGKCASLPISAGLTTQGLVQACFKDLVAEYVAATDDEAVASSCSVRQKRDPPS